MRKVLLFIFLIVVLSSSAQKVNMCDVFRQMPDSIVPYLSENNRLDFIDFMDSKMDAVVTNLLGGKSRMKKLTEKYASLSLSDALSMEMRLLPLDKPIDNSNQLICLVQTFGKDFRESEVQFYSTKWRKLPTSSYFEFLCNSQTVEALLNEEQETLTLSMTNYLDRPANDEQIDKKASLIIFKWDNGFVNKQ